MVGTVLQRHLARADAGEGLTRARLSALALLVLAAFGLIAGLRGRRRLVTQYLGLTAAVPLAIAAGLGAPGAISRRRISILARNSRMRKSPASSSC